MNESLFDWIDMQPRPIPSPDIAARLASRHWYRMVERESAPTKTSVLVAGTTIRWTRSVVRCGYWIEPQDMDEVECHVWPEDECEHCGRKYKLVWYVEEVTDGETQCDH